MSPQDFERWKRGSSSANWSDFTKLEEICRNLKNSLSQEQKGNCCYCEKKNDCQNSRDSHVEHLLPRSKYPQKTFAYDNLLLSCNFSDSCGFSKGNTCIPVAPTDPDCEKRFTYTGDGQVIPADPEDSNAEKTIKILGLNSKRLIDNRRSIIRELAKACPDYISSAAENCNEWYKGFYTVIKYVEKKL
ncbi:hypothetical protein L21SP3_00222 [Sedimentisphaera cyanobacteriorum]|uniref:TIGR02646 family protein n=1 Tax=Sedimentisphaera cyanobacteriorum TaxID=1940790 RepID=A0A1Q2HMK4_9BACT|nr:retron system putative HNH endonuclease [Sedimentisphaera cyanobacteriorum]AQQ08446.1 hypothetical protein L21SP3_00222 [Sedimentisphaera cyanobacteriorum]